MKFKGFKNIEKKLEKMSKAAKDLQGTNEVPLNELLTEAFLRKHTGFSSLEEFESHEMFSKYPTFQEIPDHELDNYVSSYSKFANWREMLDTAGKEYVVRKLGL
ncbi:hypothetical protein [Bacillus licheniformis]|uniref:hypothetical protein n=1 Tax=Bacillus licheniformis TaxID=1402 RepID=UPI000BA69893|nr:hypothetical protein [Bacillus licheniformis]PAE70599.1 hypothetical protein CHH84_19960 [Bacillus licheniformis]